MFHGLCMTCLGSDEVAQRIEHQNNWRVENAAAATLRFIEAFLESAPQYLLQRYLDLTWVDSEKTDTVQRFQNKIKREVSICLCLLSLASSTTSFIRTTRILKNSEFQVGANIILWLQSRLQGPPAKLRLFFTIFLNQKTTLN
jgi:hypothetical protein